MVQEASGLLPKSGTGLSILVGRQVSLRILVGEHAADSWFGAGLGQVMGMRHEGVTHESMR